MDASRLEIREFRPGDEERILAAYARALEPELGAAPPTPAEWRWQFLENPAGFRIWLALAPDGRVVSQLAGVPIRMAYEGGRATWSRIVDCLVDPDWRRGLRRPGPFVRTARAFAERHGGASPERDPVMYCWPPHRALRVGAKLLRLEPVRSQCKLRLESNRFQAGPSAGVRIEAVSRFSPEVAELFERVAPSRSAVAVRDAPHLNWRFAAHPSRRYRIALARTAGGTLAGYAVLGAGRLDGCEDALVADWWVAPEESSAANALLVWLAESAWEAGAEHLTAVLSETGGEWLRFQRAGFRVEAAAGYLAARCFTPPITARWLYQHWHHTLAELGP